MYKYIIKRLLALIPVVLGVTLLIFIIMSLTPGDPARIVLGNMASQEAIEEFREAQGLNDPLLVRYGKYVLNMCKGDLGNSYRTGHSVLGEILARFPATMQLATASIIFALIFSVPIGTISALKQNSIFDNVGMVISLIGIAMPAFWLGLLLIITFSLNLGWFPSSGAGSWKYLVLPTITNGVSCCANIARITRSSMLEVIRQDYIRTARAKGVSKRDVTIKHAIRNCWIPIITVAGLQFGTMLGGTVIVENVFGWPGVGDFLLKSITTKDTPCVLGTIVLFTIVFSVVNLAVDIIYAYVDPRVKAQYH